MYLKWDAELVQSQPNVPVISMYKWWMHLHQTDDEYWMLRIGIQSVHLIHFGHHLALSMHTHSRHLWKFSILNLDSRNRTFRHFQKAILIMQSAVGCQSFFADISMWNQMEINKTTNINNDKKPATVLLHKECEIQSNVIWNTGKRNGLCSFQLLINRWIMRMNKGGGSGGKDAILSKSQEKFDEIFHMFLLQKLRAHKMVHCSRRRIDVFSSLCTSPFVFFVYIYWIHYGLTFLYIFQTSVILHFFLHNFSTIFCKIFSGTLIAVLLALLHVPFMQLSKFVVHAFKSYIFNSRPTTFPQWKNGTDMKLNKKSSS